MGERAGMPSILTLRCARALVTLLILIYTHCVTSLPPFSVMVGAAYLCASSAIAGFDAGLRRVPYQLIYLTPFALAACVAGRFSWVEWVGTVTLTLPLLQSVGLVALTGANAGVGLACSMLLVEAAVVYTRRYDLNSLSTVHTASTAVIMLSMVSVIQPQFALHVAWNPVVHFIQAWGALAIWTTQEKQELALARQHTIGACASLSVTFAFVFVVFLVSGVAGTAVLHVGDSYKHTFSAVQTFVGLLYPFVLTFAVKGDPPPEGHGVFKFVSSLLLLLDQMFFPMILVGPWFMIMFWDIMALFAGAEHQWARVPSILLTVVAVSILSVVWELALELVPLPAFRKTPLPGDSYHMNSVVLPDDIADGLMDDTEERIESGDV